MIFHLLDINVRAAVVAWFYALDSEKVAFEAEAGPPLRTMTLPGGTVASEYRLGRHQVVASKMGSGCVATAVTVSRVLALNAADRVISTGPAGGIRDQVPRGTWVRVSQVAAWQQGRAGEEGRIFPTEGSDRKTGTVVSDWPAGSWQAMPECKVVSGEVFVASSKTRLELARGFDAQIVEMNSFGLMEAVAGTRAKVLILRVVSDLANEQASEDFAAFLKADKGEGGKLVADLVKKLPVGEDEPAAHDALKKLLEER